MQKCSIGFIFSIALRTLLLSPFKIIYRSFYSLSILIHVDYSLFRNDDTFNSAVKKVLVFLASAAQCCTSTLMFYTFLFKSVITCNAQCVFELSGDMLASYCVGLYGCMGGKKLSVIMFKVQCKVLYCRMPWDLMFKRMNGFTLLLWNTCTYSIKKIKRVSK